MQGHNEKGSGHVWPEPWVIAIWLQRARMRKKRQLKQIVVLSMQNDALQKATRRKHCARDRNLEHGTGDMSIVFPAGQVWRSMFPLWVNRCCVKRTLAFFGLNWQEIPRQLAFMTILYRAHGRVFLHVGQSLIQSRIAGLLPYRRINDANTCLP
mgnify:CR=1 FL=1